jgi:hypothetical protein
LKIKDTIHDRYFDAAIEDLFDYNILYVRYLSKNDFTKLDTPFKYTIDSKSDFFDIAVYTDELNDQMLELLINSKTIEHQLILLNKIYPENEIMGEDFYPGISKDHEKANHIINNLLANGYLERYSDDQNDEDFNVFKIRKKYLPK